MNNEQPDSTAEKTQRFTTRLRHVTLRGGPLGGVVAGLHDEVEQARVWPVHPGGAYVDRGDHWDWEQA